MKSVTRFWLLINLTFAFGFVCGRHGDLLYTIVFFLIHVVDPNYYPMTGPASPV